MAYYNRTAFRTPAQKKGVGILFILLGLLAFAVGLSSFISMSSMKNRCTVYEVGTAVRVNSKRVNSRHGSHTEYQAYFEVDESSPMHGVLVISPWTRKQFREGEHVKVFYDPGDTSVYYVDGAAPDSGIPGVIIGIIFAALGYLTFKNAAAEAAAAEEENDSY